MLAQIATWVKDAEDSNSRSHWEGFKCPEEPFILESVSVHSFGEFGDSVYATNLFEVSLGIVERGKGILP